MEPAVPVPAAGAVVWRPAEGPAPTEADVDVLLVHRPRYDDWSFPKGKLDPHEHPLTAAVREVAEETGVTVRLGQPLPSQEYAAGQASTEQARTEQARTKRVRYWAARPASGLHGDGFEPNDEVDQVAWVRLDDARVRLSYARDVEVLDAFATAAFDAVPTIVLRHAGAEPRESWPGDDRLRPLSAEGRQAARRLVPLLRAYGVERVLSSDAVRCTTTVAPYADKARLPVDTDHRLSEEGADTATVARRMVDLLRGDESTVLCSHRPVLPAVFWALDVDDPRLEPGGFVVVHRRGGLVHATEVHQP